MVAGSVSPPVPLFSADPVVFLAKDDFAFVSYFVLA